eukprot:5338630-Prymnesium_polylepis.1
MMICPGHCVVHGRRSDLAYATSDSLMTRATDLNIRFSTCSNHASTIDDGWMVSPPKVTFSPSPE